MKRLSTIAVTIALLVMVPASASADVRSSNGKITFLRVHDVGTGFGPPSDSIDVEVVIQLNGNTTESFGFQLRNDNNRAARQGMLDLLRDAFNNNWTVAIDYDIPRRGRMA